MYSQLVANMSRRGFVAGAVTAGAAAALACAPAAAKADEVASSLDAAPEPIAEEQVSETIEADVIIIGAGVSGLCLGARCAELGVDFKLFTASSFHCQRGGSFHGIDTKTQHDYGITDYTPANLGLRMKQEVMCGSYFVDQIKWSKWIQNNTEAMNWLIEKAEAAGLKVVLEQGYNDADNLFDFEPASHNFITVDESLLQENGGIFSLTTDFGAFQGAGLVNDLYQHMIEEVAPIDWRTKAEYLEKDADGRVVSVIAQVLDADQNPTGTYKRYVGKKGVVLATGDFSQNHEMMQKYCPWIVENDMLEDYPVNYDATFQFGGVMPGDGQRMGLWAGAAWQKSPNACLIDSLDGPYYKEIGNVDIINLNKQGLRFTNEDIPCSYSAIAALQCTDHKVYYVWPAEYADMHEEWNTFGATIPLPEDGIQYPIYCTATPEEEAAKWATNAENGTYVKGATVREVLEQLDGIDVDQAEATIAQYNQYCADGFDPDFNKNPELLIPIESESGVYYGYCITMGVANMLGSTGGLRTDVNMRVCDAADQPIPGLYNIGVMVGDCYANTYNFCICGHNLSMNCTTFPYMLAQDFANMQ